MYQREHFFRLVKNGLEVVFNLISENQNAEVLQFDLSKCERIKIEYTSPAFLGVKTLTTQKYSGNYYEIMGENKIKIVLSNLHNAPYLLNGIAFYGSYTLSICSLQIDVPSNVSQGTQDLGTITQVVVKSFEIGGGGGGGTTDYEALENKPQINSITLQGNKTADDLDLVQKSLFLNTLFPKGHIIMTYNKVSPATYIGGTWDLISEGYYPVATIKDTIDEQNERFKEAGLPNITGSLSPMYLKGDRNSVSKQGALKDSEFTENNWGGTNSGNATNLRALNFNASKSNSIYGKSNTVQPKSVLVYIWRRTDSDILTYNFTNISFKESDFNVSETGQVSSALYPEPGEIIQTIRSAFDPNTKYVGTVWRKFIDGIYFSSGNTFEYRGEQLPNIKGEIGDINFRGSSSQSIYKNGVFTDTIKANGNNIGCGTPAGDVVRALNFNASKSNSVYADNGKVRPNTITTYAWIRVDGLSQEELTVLEDYLV